MKNKQLLRNSLKEQLQQIQKPLYEHYSYCIAKNLYQTIEWEKAQTVAITLSRPPEVDTYQIIRKAWELEKTIVVPKCDPKTKTMEFFILRAFNELESVYFGLLEPLVEKTTKVTNAEIDLMIVPGLGFEKDGFRIGFGGGFYDRYLATYQGMTVSLCFPEQLLEQLPVEPHDKKVKRLITPTGIFTCHD